MAIRTVVTRGFANGSFSGTIPLVVTRGYGIGEPPEVREPTHYHTLHGSRAEPYILHGTRTQPFVLNINTVHTIDNTDP